MQKRVQKTLWIGHVKTSLGKLVWRLMVRKYFFEDSEGVLVTNIGSYMGGVDSWQNEDEHIGDFYPQTMDDKVLEVVNICGAWHLGKIQIDGEPWVQLPCILEIAHHIQAFMLKRISKEPLGHVALVVAKVLENVECGGVINAT